MSERHFDASLRELKEDLVSMAGLVERALDLATEALLERNTAKLSQVYELERKVNQAHISVDDSCVKLMALQQPLAADLRLIVAILKINTDLERMGDQAVNIAHNCDRYLQGEALDLSLDFAGMSAHTRKMVREVLDAFVRSSESKARDVLAMDDTVDAFKHCVLKDVIEYLKQHPNDAEQALSLILIARNLERIGDHATNIAEDVIFALTGEDVRHGPRRDTLKESLK
jgi:phosphate transport system protein